MADDLQASSGQARLSDAMQALAANRPELAAILGGFLAVVAEEALRNRGFAEQLNDVLNNDHGGSAAAALLPVPAAPPAVATGTPTRAKRSPRPPGPWDPFVVYADGGEVGLREQLGQLELEQLRSMIVEHGLDRDGRVVRLKTISKVIERIVDRVVDRATKGDAFRGV